MSRFCCLLTLLLSGCGPLRLHTETTPAGAEVAPAQAGNVNGFGELSPSPDPRIKLAEITRDEIGKKEEALHTRLGRVRDAIAALKVTDADRKTLTAQALQSRLAQLEATVEAGIDDVRRTADSVTHYRRELFHAQAAYRAAAQAWRDRSLDFPAGSDLRGLNAEFAANYEATAIELPRRLRVTDQFGQKLPALEAFLKDYRQFLTDFGLFLRAVLDRSSGDPAVRFLQRKEARHSDVDAYHRLLLEFLGDLRQGAVSVQIQTEVREEQEQAATAAREQAARDEVDRAKRALEAEEERRQAALEARAQRIYSLYKSNPKQTIVRNLTPHRLAMGSRGSFSHCIYAEVDEHLPVIDEAGTYVGRVRVLGAVRGGDFEVAVIDITLRPGLRVVSFSNPRNEPSGGRATEVLF